MTQMKLDKVTPLLYPRPQEVEWKSGEFIVGPDTKICVVSEADLYPAELLQKEIQDLFGIFIPLETHVSSSHILIGRKNQGLKAEEYALSVSQDGIELLGADDPGVIYGIQTILQLAIKNHQGYLTFPAVDIIDYPNMPIRGVHLYIPAQESIEGFKRLIRMLAYVKMNTLVIEVGGGMEYERHPEINQAWEKLCKDAQAYPGGPRGIQSSGVYWKNSLHTELGGGSYLTKGEVRDIVDYAKGLGFKVVPEIQGLSHAYYLTMAHREIAEDPEDPFPDTYCPSNPDTYRLYFDVAAEVIEVFEPEWVSIGHDEVRMLAQCPLCKDKTGEELLANDINTLYNYFKAKGIKVMMWGEKLQKFIGYNGKPYGGVFQERWDEKGRYWRVPETYKAINLVPKDILMLDWYHMLSEETESEFEKEGFKEFFGNFRGSMIANWDIRSSRNNLLGAQVSTWCLADEYTIARNNTIFEFLFSAGILWTEDYNDTMWEDECWMVVRLMPAIKEMLQGRRYSLSGGNENGFKTFHMDNTVEVIKWGSDIEFSHVFMGDNVKCFNPFAMDDVDIAVDSNVNTLIFLHAVLEPMKFIPSWDFVDMSEYLLGGYEVIFEDGSIEDIELHYGIHLGQMDMEWTRYRGQDDEAPVEVDDLTGEGAQTSTKIPPYYNPKEPWAGSLMYFTIPVRAHINGKIKTLYAYEWINPYPDKKVVSVRAKDTSNQRVLLFGLAGTLL